MMKTTDTSKEAMRLASTYESDPKRRQDWERNVRAELRRLVAEQPAPATELREQEPEEPCDSDALIIFYHEETIKRLKERITILEQPAQPEQEPVAWMNAKRDMTYLYGPYNADDIPLYTSPPTQEIVCSTGLCHFKAQCEWVNATTWRGLTDEQIKSIYTQETGSLIDASPWALIDFARALEAKLKEKNCD